MTKNLIREELLNNNTMHRSGKGFDPHEIYTCHSSKAKRIKVAGPPAYKPSMVKLPGGDILLSYVRTTPDANVDVYRATVEVIRSNDKGHTWSQPVTAISEDFCPMDHYIIPFPDGTLLIASMRIVLENKMHPWQGPYLCKSTDGGKTWAQPWHPDVSTISPEGPFVACDRSHVVLPDGTLLLFVGTYKTPEEPFNYMMVSHDKGQTFDEVHMVTNISGDSTFTLCNDGSIAGALRINADNYPSRDAHKEFRKYGECVHFMGFTRSTDGGKTWAQPHPITGFNEIPGHLISLKDGRLMLTYGSRHFPVGVRAILTKPNSYEWDFDNPIILAWHGTTSFADGRSGGKNTIGHPYTIQFEDETFYTIYYYCPDPLNLDNFEIEGLSWKMPEIVG